MYKKELIRQMYELLNTFEKATIDDEAKLSTLNEEIFKLRSICDIQQDKLYYLEDELNKQKEKNEKIARILMGD